jgi:hypothetical protein
MIGIASRATRIDVQIFFSLSRSGQQKPPTLAFPAFGAHGALGASSRHGGRRNPRLLREDLHRLLEPSVEERALSGKTNAGGSRRDPGILVVFNLLGGRGRDQGGQGEKKNKELRRKTADRS